MQSTRIGSGLSAEERLDWLRLIRSQNVGPRTFRALINHYGNARDARSLRCPISRAAAARPRPGTSVTREEALREINAAKRCRR